MFYFPIYWEYSSQLTNIFQRGSNRQPACLDDFLTTVWSNRIDLPSNLRQERMGEAETVQDRCRKILAKLETGIRFPGITT